MNLETLIPIEITALALQTFFSGSEMALISADKIELRKRANAGAKSAKLALEMLSHPENILATTLVGTNICVAFQATLMEMYFHSNYGPEYGFMATVILSPLILIFGEFIPKSIAQRLSVKIAPLVIRPIMICRIIFSPLTWVLGKYTKRLSKILQPIQDAVQGRRKPSHREELSYLLSIGRKETTLKSSERKMIRRIFEFSKSAAKKALIPLVHVDMIPDTMTHTEALETFLNYGHSRLPVYHERVDNVVGVIHVFDLFSEIDPNRSIKEFMHPAFYAPESQQLDDLLYTMRKRGIPMATVVDEYGGAVGIVTLEDILEEIVGDIKDEYDQEAALFKQLSENEFLFHAQMEVNAINEKFKLEIPKGDYETISGFLLQQFNRIPETGDELFFRNLKFVIRKASSRAIEQVYVEVQLDE